MINKQELVTILKEQHRELKVSLVGALDSIKNDSTEDSLNFLIKFKIDLLKHLELENGTFYPDYLNISKDQEKIKKFVEEMVLIGEKVMEFLNKYDSTEKISIVKEDFEIELKSIIDTLKLRIETEEEGLYDIYVLSN